MFDITFRPLKDRLFDPLCTLIPPSITPLHITILAFASGIVSCICAAQALSLLSLCLWLLNRALDCLDGAVARQRNQASDVGGFLDLLGDFIVYSVIPICCAIGIDGQASNTEHRGLWMAVAVLEGTFHVNNFVLFFIAAILEKRKAAVSTEKGVHKERRRGEERVKELTSVAMRPALIEGLESGVIFTVMLAFPEWTQSLAWAMAVLVSVGIVQRVVWVVPVLG